MNAPLTPKDQFAEYLSRGWSVPEIRARMSLNNNQAQGLMRKIRQDLGPQAA